MASEDASAGGSVHRTPTMNHHMQSPSFQRSKGVSTPTNRNRAQSLTSCASATSTGRKGVNIGLNLVSDASKMDLNRHASIKTPKRKLFTDNSAQNNAFTAPPTPFEKEIDSCDDDILPYSAQVEEEDGLTTKFRRLASKEREILELKNKVKEMLDQKKSLELDLQMLKTEIQKELLSNVMSESHLKSPTKIKKVTLTPTGSNFNPLLETHAATNVGQHFDDKNQSWLSKPLTLIQQFDNMVSQEMEWLNMSDNNTSHGGRMINDPIKSMADNSDVINKVSNKLWSFVNDIKSNLLVDEDRKFDHNHSESGNEHNAPNLIDLDSPKTHAENTKVMSASSATSDAVELKSANSKIAQDEFHDDDELWDNEYVDV